MRSSPPHAPRRATDGSGAARADTDDMSEQTHTDDLEARLAEDEARLAADEQRLAADETRIEADEDELQESRVVAWLGIGLLVVLAVAVAALVIALIALQNDVHSMARSAPADSVSSAAIRDAAVTTSKLEPGAVDRIAVSGGAIGPAQLARDAVSGANVARDSLTGADVRESTLATVPAARRARSATDAERLAGLGSAAFLSRVTTTRAATPIDAGRTKGPLMAACPNGSRVVSGGAAVDGATRRIGIVVSAPQGRSGWTATAHASGSPAPTWRLVVTAICAAGGE